MLAFRVALNGKTLATAGISGPHVLSAIVTSVIRGSKAPRALPDRPSVAHELGLTLGALDSTAQEHVSWIESKLEVGDQIVIEVLEADRVDEPLGRRGKSVKASEKGARARSTRTERPGRRAQKRSAARSEEKAPAAPRAQRKLARGSAGTGSKKRARTP